MSPRKLPLFVFASLLSFSSLACVVRARPVAYYEPAPAPASEVVYYDDPGDDAVVVVDSGPPPEQVENPGPPPRRGHVWVRGRWIHTARGWAWRSGHWERPRAGHAWVPGRWQQHNHRWVWVKGHWQRGRIHRG